MITEVTTEMITESRQKCKSYIRAFPATLFKNNILLEMDDDMFKWVCDEFKDYYDILNPYIEKRTGNSMCNLSLFAYKLEYEGVEDAIEYMKKFNQHLYLSMFFDRDRPLKNSYDYLKKTGEIPENNISGIIPDKLLLAMRENGYDQKKLVKYLFKYGVLIDQYDLLFNEQLDYLPEIALKYSLSKEEMLFLESKGYTYYVSPHSIISEETLQIAKRTGCVKDFDKHLSPRFKSML